VYRASEPRKFTAQKPIGTKKGSYAPPKKNGLFMVGLGCFAKLGLQIVKAGFRFFHLRFQLGAVGQ